MILLKSEHRCPGSQGGELWLFPAPGHLSDMLLTQLSQGLTMATSLGEGPQGKTATPLLSQAVTDHPAISPLPGTPLRITTPSNVFILH